MPYWCPGLPLPLHPVVPLDGLHSHPVPLPRSWALGAQSCQHPGLPWQGPQASTSAPQEAAHKRLMCRRQAQEAQTPEPLRRHRSLAAQSLLSLAEKQRRVLRNLRRLESLGVVSASDCYQGLVDELAKVTAGAWACVCVCVCPHILAPQGWASP